MSSARKLSEPKWSFDLPVKLKLAIADCITLYSKIESCIVELVWVLEAPDVDRKREIAKSLSGNIKRDYRVFGA
jgi:hypothetical protein